MRLGCQAVPVSREKGIRGMMATKYIANEKAPCQRTLGVSLHKSRHQISEIWCLDLCNHAYFDLFSVPVGVGLDLFFKK